MKAILIYALIGALAPVTDAQTSAVRKTAGPFRQFSYNYVLPKGWKVATKPHLTWIEGPDMGQVFLANPKGASLVQIRAIEDRDGKLQESIREQYRWGRAHGLGILDLHTDKGDILGVFVAKKALKVSLFGKPSSSSDNLRFHAAINVILPGKLFMLYFSGLDKSLVSDGVKLAKSLREGK